MLMPHKHSQLIDVTFPLMDHQTCTPQKLRHLRIYIRRALFRTKEKTYGWKKKSMSIQMKNSTPKFTVKNKTTTLSNTVFH